MSIIYIVIHLKAFNDKTKLGHFCHSMSNNPSKPPKKKKKGFEETQKTVSHYMKEK